MEIAIGEADVEAFCHACEDAGCEVESECSVEPEAEDFDAEP
jgi:hypothetical protein